MICEYFNSDLKFFFLLNVYLQYKEGKNNHGTQTTNFRDKKKKSKLNNLDTFLCLFFNNYVILYII